MAEGKESKTAFHTHYGLLESLVIPFRLTNAMVTCHNYINDVLVPYLDRFCTTYPGDTSIHLHSFEEYQ
jgi:hypothetical protein